MTTIDASKVGMEFEPLTFQVERGKIVEVARAIREDNPVYFDTDRPPAPLTFSRTFVVWGDSVVKAYQSIGVDMTRIVHGGQEFEFFEPVYAGDTLTMTGKLLDVYSKEGKRGGLLQFIVWQWTYTNQHGRVALTTTNTTIQTSQSVA